jgi:hypothetical protein
VQTTKQIYSDNGRYSKEREQLHQSIINEILDVYDSSVEEPEVSGPVQKSYATRSEAS